MEVIQTMAALLFRMACFSVTPTTLLQLLLGITFLIYLFYQPGMLKNHFAAIAITFSLIFMLRTGSRGCMLAACAYAAAPT